MPARRLRFATALRQAVQGVTERSGWLIEGPAGWGEWSPLPSWSRDEQVLAYRAALEAASQPFPAPVSASVEVNAMVPRVAPALAARLARESGCNAVKVKVGDPDGEARVAAVREAVGPAVRLRVDANAAWDADQAVDELSRLQAYSIEFVEDPVPTLAALAELRRRSPVPVAAEMPIRSLDDVARMRRLEAADLLVVKPQRLGGVGAALRAAELAGVPVIVSSALETSVGLAACLAVAAALPAAGYAHGIGTASHLTADVTASPLLPVGGRLAPRRVAPDLLLAAG
jgi:O-succinylbenzoate synthase